MKKLFALLALLAALPAMAQEAPLTLTQSHSTATAGTQVKVTAKQTGATACYWFRGGTSASDPEILTSAVSLQPSMTRTIAMGTTELRHGMVCDFSTGRYMNALRVQPEDIQRVVAETTCMPKPIGGGSLPYTRTYNVGSSNVGVCAVWHCKSDTSVKGYVDPGACGTLREIAAWPFTLAKFAEMGEAKTIDVWKTSPALRSLTDVERQVLADLRKENAPALPVYVTAKNGLFQSRPTYKRLADGKRTTTATTGQRVGIGVRCDCTKKTEEAAFYCSVSGQPNLAAEAAGQTLPEGAVALCIR